MWTEEQIVKAAESLGDEAAQQMRDANQTETRVAAEARQASMTAAVKGNEAYKTAHPRVMRAIEGGTVALPVGLADDQVPQFLQQKEAEYEAMGVPAVVTPPPTQGTPPPGTPPTIQPWSAEGGTTPEGGAPLSAGGGPFAPGTPGYANSGEEMQSYAQVEDLMVVEAADAAKFVTSRDRDRKLVMAIEQANKMPGRSEALGQIKRRHEHVPPGMAMRSGGRG